MLRTHNYLIYNILYKIINSILHSNIMIIIISPIKFKEKENEKLAEHNKNYQIIIVDI